MKQSVLLFLALALPAVAQTPEQSKDRRELAAERVIAGQDCPSCDLFQVDFSYQRLDGRNLAGARLRQANLSLATLDKTDLSGGDLSNTSAFGGRFGDADLSNADLTRTSFVGAWLGGADLGGADLTDADLSGAYLFTARGLTQAQLDAACGDETTALPDGLTLSLCPGATAALQLRGRQTDSER